MCSQQTPVSCFPHSTAQSLLFTDAPSQLYHMFWSKVTEIYPPHTPHKHSDSELTPTDRAQNLQSGFTQPEMISAVKHCKGQSLSQQSQNRGCFFFFKLKGMPSLCIIWSKHRGAGRKHTSPFPAPGSRFHQLLENLSLLFQAFSCTALRACLCK